MALTPIQPADASEDVAKTYSRVQELLGTESLPEPFLVYGNVESFLKDFYMNFKKFVFSDGQLDAKHKAAIGFAVAVHAKCKPWQEYFQSRCTELGWSDEQVNEILAVAATNYMYNTFFKFRAISGTDRFDGMGVGLRAHTFSKTTLEDSTVELINIAISDLNACQPCTEGHVAKAMKLDLKGETILEAIQCAATVYAGAMFLSAAN